MTYHSIRRGLLLPLLAPVVLSACVSQQDYDAVVAKNQLLERQLSTETTEKRQLQQQLAGSQQQTARLTGAIRYSVTSDLLFASGSWQMSAEGQRIIARYASQLASTQQAKV